MPRARGETKVVMATKVHVPTSTTFKAKAAANGQNVATRLAWLVAQDIEGFEPAAPVIPGQEEFPGLPTEERPTPVPHVVIATNTTELDAALEAALATDLTGRFTTPEEQYDTIADDIPMRTARVGSHRHRRGEVSEERYNDGNLEQKHECAIDDCDTILDWKRA